MVQVSKIQKDFEKYLTNNIKQGTISNYVSGVNAAQKWISKKGKIDLWDVPNMISLFADTAALNQIENDPTFPMQTENQTTRPTYLQGWKAYKDFVWNTYKNKLKNNVATQIIYFGAPGSGKSYKVKSEYDDIFTPDQIIRTTFHPDTDYASFVGGYKPKLDANGNITYGFVPQCFTNAYVKAWIDPENPYFLIIEEINRGNCAQIFGDIFQLLDRNDYGFSEYPINADEDLKNYLEKVLKDKNGIKGGKLQLPPNLSLIATMNTSDQSLFPMDSAFKRRWDWEYVPIDYNNQTSSKFEITLDDGKVYKWPEFLEKVNAKIRELTDSEDKQMGNFFIKHDVDQKEFVNKVMFYLWSEVGKENYGTGQRLFVYNNNTEQEFSFNDLFGVTQSSSDILKGFMDGLGVAPISPSNP